MGRKHYTEEHIAHAMAVYRSNGGNLKRTSAATGVARSTLRQWASGDYGEGKSPASIEDKTDAIGAKLTAKFGEIAVASLDAARDKIADASFRDLLIGAGIATEKRELLQGGRNGGSRGGTTIQIALVGADALRTLAAHMTRAQLPAGDVVEGTYKEDEGAA